MGSSPDSYLTYIKYRALIEEFNSNVFVEDVIANEDDTRIVWLRFAVRESDPQRVAEQVLGMCKDFDLAVVIFAIGKSPYMCYASTLGAFFVIRKNGQAIPSMAEVERLAIPKTRVVSRIKNLFLEDKRRKLMDADYKNEIS